MILSLATLILPLLLGITAVSAARVVQEKVAVVVVGSVAGLSVFVTAVYVVSLAIPISTALLVGALIICLLGTILIAWRTEALHYYANLPLDRVAVAVAITLFALFSVIAPRLLIQKPDGLYTGILNAYGDVAWHMANITAFAEGQSMPPENPIFAGHRLTYPFLANFLSGLLLIGGAGYTAIVTLPALLLIPLFFTLLYVFVRDVVSSHPAFSPTAIRWASIAVVLLMLFSGTALGWTRIWDDWQRSETSLGYFLTHLPTADYAGLGTDPAGHHFLNTVMSLLLPQRSFLFGLPLALAIVLLLQTPARNNYLAAGALCGLLPLFHAHTVIALLPILLGLFLLRPGRQWLAFSIPALIIGVPEIAYYLGATAEGGSFMRWDPGWTAGNENLLWFWFKNTGFLLPIALVGLWLPLSRRLKVLGMGALAIFIVANLWLFAPWAWDNFKLLIYWYLFSLPLVAATLVYVWQRWSYLLIHGLIVMGVAFHLLSGGLDLWKVSLPTATTWREWETDGVTMAQQITAVTQPGDILLSAPIHNSAVVLSGRPLYLGYPAHVWSHGGDPWTRERAIGPYYEGRRTSLPDLQPDYALVGPVERGLYPDLTVRPEWQEVARAGEHTLYRVPAE